MLEVFPHARGKWSWPDPPFSMHYFCPVITYDGMFPWSFYPTRKRYGSYERYIRWKHIVRLCLEGRLLTADDISLLYIGRPARGKFGMNCTGYRHIPLLPVNGRRLLPSSCLYNGKNNRVWICISTLTFGGFSLWNERNLHMWQAFLLSGKRTCCHRFAQWQRQVPIWPASYICINSPFSVRMQGETYHIISVSSWFYQFFNDGGE